MKPRFEIEDVYTELSRSFVRARILNSQYFAVADGSMLGGVRLSTLDFAELQPDIFRFRLDSVGDIERFHARDVVALTQP